MKNIANIVNFVRAVEPREKDNSYLPETMLKELELCRKYGFKSTVLLQYDALILPEYREMLSQFSYITEIGIWFEVVQPLVEDCGLKWRGKFPWDWHNDVGFLVGYEPEERKLLIDRFFEVFKGYYGEYPKAVGSWHIDAFSLRYISEKYGITVSCNCKDQYGTDGYTIWGGYYAGAYYPSVNNMICPANSPENQINVPVFRMLGSDPIYQYDLGLENGIRAQGVSSMEPVYGCSGSSEKWVKWYFDEVYNGKSLALSYTQFGQENSFGWRKISQGLEMQFEILSEQIKLGKVELLTLGEAGEWFSENFSETPASALCIDSDYSENGKKSFWYNCKNYRINLLFENGVLHIRDFYLFRDDFCEKFLDKKETEHSCGYYNLPVMDGYRFSSAEKKAGIYPLDCAGRQIPCSDYVSETDDEKQTATCGGGGIKYIFTPERIKIHTEKAAHFAFDFADNADVPYVSADNKELFMKFKGTTENDYLYSVKLEKGFFGIADGKPFITPENGMITIITKR